MYVQIHHKKYKECKNIFYKTFFFYCFPTDSGQSDNSNQQTEVDIKPPPNGKFCLKIQKL